MHITGFHTCALHSVLNYVILNGLPQYRFSLDWNTSLDIYWVTWLVFGIIIQIHSFIFSILCWADSFDYGHFDCGKDGLSQNRKYIVFCRVLILPSPSSLWTTNIGISKFVCLFLQYTSGSQISLILCLYVSWAKLCLKSEVNWHELYYHIICLYLSGDFKISCLAIFKLSTYCVL